MMSGNEVKRFDLHADMLRNTVPSKKKVPLVPSVQGTCSAKNNGDRFSAIALRLAKLFRTKRQPVLYSSDGFSEMVGNSCLFSLAQFRIHKSRKNDELYRTVYPSNSQYIFARVDVYQHAQGAVARTE